MVLYVLCVCVFSLRQESPNMILGDKPLIFKVGLSNFCLYPLVDSPCLAADEHPLLCFQDLSR
jgi:hypothetical protein